MAVLAATRQEVAEAWVGARPAGLEMREGRPSLHPPKGSVPSLQRKRLFVYLQPVKYSEGNRYLFIALQDGAA